MRKITQVDRVLKILEMLSQGREVCLTQDPLSKKIKLLEDMKNSFYEFEDLNIGLRALQKDMKYIKEYLGENLIKKGACYRLAKKEYLDNFFKDNYEEIKKFFHAISLIDKSILGNTFKKYSHIFEALQSQQKGVYLFLENPFEELKQLDLQKKLENYILHKRYIHIIYYSDRKYDFYKVQPYKIIYHSGNWYLAVITTKDYEINDGFKLLRLNFIKKIEPCKDKITNFHEDPRVKYFLEHQFQSLFTSFNKKFFTVKVKISKEIARYFEVKKYLKSQRIIKNNSGNLIVEFTNNNPQGKPFS